MPFSSKSRGIKDTEMVLDGVMEHRLNLVISANSTFCGGFSKEEPDFGVANKLGPCCDRHGCSFLKRRGAVEKISRADPVDSLAAAPGIGAIPPEH